MSIQKEELKESNTEQFKSEVEKAFKIANNYICKDLSDIFEALIGAAFLSSCSLSKTLKYCNSANDSKLL